MAAEVIIRESLMSTGEYPTQGAWSVVIYEGYDATAFSATPGIT